MARYIFLDGQVFSDGALYVSTLREARRSLETAIFLVVTPALQNSDAPHAEKENNEEIEEQPE